MRNPVHIDNLDKGLSVQCTVFTNIQQSGFWPFEGVMLSVTHLRPPPLAPSAFQERLVATLLSLTIQTWLDVFSPSPNQHWPVRSGNKKASAPVSILIHLSDAIVIKPM